MADALAALNAQKAVYAAAQAVAEAEATLATNKKAMMMPSWLASHMKKLWLPPKLQQMQRLRKSVTQKLHWKLWSRNWFHCRAVNTSIRDHNFLVSLLALAVRPTQLFHDTMDSPSFDGQALPVSIAKVVVYRS